MSVPFSPHVSCSPRSPRPVTQWMIGDTTLNGFGLPVLGTPLWNLSATVVGDTQLLFVPVAPGFNSQDKNSKVRVHELDCVIYDDGQPSPASTTVALSLTFPAGSASLSQTGTPTVTGSFTVPVGAGVGVYSVPSFVAAPPANATMSTVADTTSSALLTSTAIFGATWAPVSIALPGYDITPTSSVGAFGLAAAVTVPSTTAITGFGFNLDLTSIAGSISGGLSSSTSMTANVVSTYLYVANRQSVDLGFPAVVTQLDPLNSPADATRELLDLRNDVYLPASGSSMGNTGRSWRITLPCPIDLVYGQVLVAGISFQSLTLGQISVLIFCRARVEVLDQYGV